MEQHFWSLICINKADKSNSGLKARGEGYAQVLSERQGKLFDITNALHVPCLRLNVSSVYLLESKGFEVIFESHSIYIVKGNHRYFSGIK